MVFLNTKFIYIFFLGKNLSYLNYCAHYLPPTVFSFRGFYKQPWLTCVTMLIILLVEISLKQLLCYGRINLQVKMLAFKSALCHQWGFLDILVPRWCDCTNNIIISNCVGGEWWPRGSRWQKAGNPDDETDTQKGFLQGFVRSPWPFSVESALPIL